MMCSVGCRVHAAAPASAIDAPIRRRKSRRPLGSVNSEAPSGNSRWSMAVNSGVSATSSRLRQNAGPRWSASRARIAERSMARRTAREALHVVLLHEVAPDGELVTRGDVPHLVDRLPRAEELFGRAVAGDAPLHLQGVGLVDAGHLVDPAVAGLAADALLHVDRVVEVDEVGQVVHAVPDQRLAG